MNLMQSFVLGVFVVLQPLILSELVSHKDITEALGILLFSSGIGYFIGTPLMAVLHDHWGSYDICYTASGVATGIIALLLLIIQCLQFRHQLEVKREQRLKQKIENDMKAFLFSNTDTPSGSDEFDPQMIKN